MKDTLATGLETSAEHLVTDDMSPPHLPMKVLSTPSMIGLMERTCLESVIAHLDEGESTVGTHVCVSHVAAAASGETVTVTARLAEINKRRLTFEVKAMAGDKLLGEGTHQRAVIDTRRFG
ncbi:MAG: thioesterase family protein [Acidimicrobiales bacterium]|nr:thioesterase family protein [Acidimicrobiales bacterium]